MIESKNGRFIGFEQLKQRVSMVQVLERYGMLESLRRSGESLTGVCPLHRGHNTTQFRVSLNKNCWICFGDWRPCCCRTGSTWNLVMGHRQLTGRSFLTLKPMGRCRRPSGFKTGRCGLH